MRSIFDVRMGNVDDPKDAELIKEASPLFKADKISRPLLIGQGANDPRVKQAEAEQIVAAIEKNGGRVTYVLYPDEGHGFARPENRIDFNARAEAFLAENLGGRCEPLARRQGPRLDGRRAGGRQELTRPHDLSSHRPEARIHRASGSSWQPIQGDYPDMRS